MLRDLGYGVRALLQAKGWTAVVVVSLALGIGANAAIFSAINNLLTAAQVQGNLGGVFRHEAQDGLGAYLASLPDEKRLTSDNRNRVAVPNLVVDGGARGVYDPTPADVLAVRILSVVVVLVLLIVCANVANLLLSRSSARQKEVSIRLSMGGTRGRLIRQLLTESVLLASMGGALGILVAYWGTRLLPRALGQFHPLDWRVLVFVLAVTSLTGIVFGIAPALRATSVDLASALNENSRSMARSRSALSKALLIAQVAISLMLLIGAGLFLRTLQNLRRENVGFNPQNLVVFQVNPRLIQYDPRGFSLLYQRIIDRLKAVPGFRAVTFSHVGLLAGSENSTNIFVQGRAYPLGRANDNKIDRLVVWDNFFETMGMPLLAGRGFRAADDAGAPKVAVINESAARKYFPNENPLGHRFGSNLETSGQLEIVGVLRDAKYVNVRDPAPPTMYLPYLQNSPVSAVFEVRIAGDPAVAMGDIRRAVREIQPDLPVPTVSTQIDEAEKGFVQEKTFAVVSASLGALALLVAAIGLFGLMSYSVTRRTKEIGIRMALGAEGHRVLFLVMRESMVLAIAGVGIGLAASTAVRQLVASQLYGVTPTDTITILLAVGVMVLVSALAGYLPARHAARIDPMIALRYE